MKIKKLTGWTLSELLVVMILTGLIFVAALDGTDLVRRFILRKTSAWTASATLLDSYSRINDLFSQADSLSREEDGCTLYREHRALASICQEQGWLICSCRQQIDTLFQTPVRLLVRQDSLQLTLENNGKDISLWFGLPFRSAKGIATACGKQEEKYENQFRSWKSFGNKKH